MNLQTDTYISSILSLVWEIFGTKIPGYDITFSRFFITLLVIDLTFKIFCRILGLTDFVDNRESRSYRKERRNDYYARRGK